MKYYLCIVGYFQEGGEESIIQDCLKRNIYEYHSNTRQKGAGNQIKEGDNLLLVFRKDIVAYGTAAQQMGTVQGYEKNWIACPIDGKWKRIEPVISLPYGIYWHTLQGTKQSVVKEIDAVWANELILQALMSNPSNPLPTDNTILMHLPSIAVFLKKDFLMIPAVQRGKVWNAARVETLWDSLMRGIPIGSLSIRSVVDANTGEKHWDLLDGQQRANAISLAYQDFPPKSNEDYLLWLDVGADKDNKGENHYYFKVTTPSHPWGYNISSDEKANVTLSAQDKVRAMEAIKGYEWSNKDKKNSKPYPKELWPFKADCPVPFSVLRLFCEEGHYEIETFKKFVIDRYSKENWCRHFLDNNLIEVVNPILWKDIVSGVNSLNDIKIAAQNVGNLRDEDIGLYFKRMNKAGIEPNDEEIRYSLLKAKLPSLKSLDKVAIGRMGPARLANVAMLTYKVIKGGEWTSTINNKDIANFAKDGDFVLFVEKNETKSDFEKLLYTVEEWLLYNEQENPIGIPAYLYSRLIRNNPSLYRLLLLIAHQYSSNVDKKSIIAMVTLFYMYGSGDNSKEGYEILSRDNQLESNIKYWLYKSVKDGVLLIPPTYEIYNNITKAASKQDKIALNRAWDYNSPYGKSVNKTWYWTDNSSRFLLLYSLRKYINENFYGYDPADAAWNENNIPWDYDHIFPQSWHNRKRGVSVGEYQDEVGDALNSIGNIAPIYFSLNRSKSDAPPCNYLNEENASLYITPDDFFFQPNRYKLKYDKDEAFRFIHFAMERLSKIYQEWYHSLSIDTMLDFDNINSLRHNLINMIHEKYPDTKTYYVYPRGKQEELLASEPWNWGREWIACGFLKRINIDGVSQRCYLSMCSNGRLFQFGVRRHPEEISIGGDESQWWFSTKGFEKYEELFGETFCKEKESRDIDFLFKEFENLINVVDDLQNEVY